MAVYYKCGRPQLPQVLPCDFGNQGRLLQMTGKMNGCSRVCDGCSGGSGAMFSRWLNKAWYGEMPQIDILITPARMFGPTSRQLGSEHRNIGPLVRDEARVK